jgi:hypothetical protein
MLNIFGVTCESLTDDVELEHSKPSEIRLQLKLGSSIQISNILYVWRSLLNFRHCQHSASKDYGRASTQAHVLGTSVKLKVPAAVIS